ncbi:sensor histidine kinase [Weissella bombi]|uniref:histidine kinase n=1 Tax=Weissella bombi TaxID=1505725 RepID=A0A1C3YTY6_9LACO|nr:ATP-binding protein [Weissella bombi]SCB73492.1 two-component system, OmpR family, phosphate regulon sensor histidine kinase PhoR [Weissella bombi]
MNIDELIESAKRFVLFWFVYAAIIWLILWLTSLTGDQNVTLKWHVLVLLSMILSGATTLALEMQRQRRDAHLALFIEKLQDLETTHTHTAHVLMRPDDSLAPLAAAINDVQHLNSRRIKIMQEQSSTMETLMENMPLGVLQITTERKIIQANDQARKLLGVSTNLVNAHYDNVIKYHRLMELFEQALRQKKNIRELVKLDNKMVDVSIVYYQTRERHYELLVLLYDMTEVIQMKDMQTSFVANASHELRTPLTAIAGFTETLLSGAQNDPVDRQEFLEIIQSETNRLLDLTDDILTLAKAPEQAHSLQEFNMSEMVDKIFNTKQPKDRLNLTLKNDVSETLMVKQDKRVFEQILTNLIGNAMKYNRQNGTVKVSAMVTAHELAFAVKDTGLGIPSDEQDRVFERFYRVDKSRTQSIPGTGLGLAIVHDLVEQSQGQIELESQVGVGSTITVTLPLQ